jgi:hypothetical protein
MKEWRRHREEATLLDPVVVEAAPDSLDALVAEMSTMLASYDRRIDMEAVAIKMMAMVRGINNLIISSCSIPPWHSPLWPFTNLHSISFGSLASCLHVTVLP